jgi:hypothetical protein
MGTNTFPGPEAGDPETRQEPLNCHMLTQRTMPKEDQSGEPLLQPAGRHLNTVVKVNRNLQGRK